MVWSCSWVTSVNSYFWVSFYLYFWEGPFYIVQASIRTCYVNQTDLSLTEFHLPLPSRCHNSLLRIYCFHSFNYVCVSVRGYVHECRLQMRSRSFRCLWNQSNRQLWDIGPNYVCVSMWKYVHLCASSRGGQ